MDAYLRLHNQPTSPELPFYILSQSSLKDFFNIGDFISGCEHCSLSRPGPNYSSSMVLPWQFQISDFRSNISFPLFRIVNYIFGQIKRLVGKPIGKSGVARNLVPRFPSTFFHLFPLFPPFSTKVLFPLLNC